MRILSFLCFPLKIALNPEGVFEVYAENVLDVVWKCGLISVLTSLSSCCSIPDFFPPARSFGKDRCDVANCFPNSRDVPSREAGAVVVCRACE